MSTAFALFLLPIHLAFFVIFFILLIPYSLFAGIAAILRSACCIDTQTVESVDTDSSTANEASDAVLDRAIPISLSCRSLFVDSLHAVFRRPLFVCYLGALGFTRAAQLVRIRARFEPESQQLCSSCCCCLTCCCNNDERVMADPATNLSQECVQIIGGDEFSALKDELDRFAHSVFTSSSSSSSNALSASISSSSTASFSASASSSSERRRAPKAPPPPTTRYVFTSRDSLTAALCETRRYNISHSRIALLDAANRRQVGGIAMCPYGGG